MRFNDFNLYFTPIEQIIGLDELRRLDIEDEKKSSANLDLDWGDDRQVSLIQNDTDIKNQWNGTCTSFATVAAIENKLKGKYHLSERSLWDFYSKFSTKIAIESATNNYLLEEQFWPQNENRLKPEYSDYGRFRISKYEYIKRDYPRVLKAIDQGNPCIVALSTPKKLFYNAQVETNSKVSRRGGHAMCVSGYKIENGQAYFLVKNSWGKKSGNDGYHYINFDLYTRGKRRYCIFWEIKEIEIKEIPKSYESTPVELMDFWEFL